MRKIILAVSALFLIFGNLLANEVNIFSARHYDSDVQLYEKFTAKTGIKVNVVSGKDKALQKRISEEGVYFFSGRQMYQRVGLPILSWFVRN